MSLFRILFFVSAVLVKKALSDVDSAGTDFITIIPWNNNAADTQSTVYLDFANADPTRIATVQVSYSVYAITVDDVTTSTRHFEVTVNPYDSVRYPFEGDSIYPYLTNGLFTEYPSTKVHITSDIPISVFAHNYASDGAGDTFAVLPTAMASKEYSFSLPAPDSAAGLSMVYFLPTVIDTNIELTVITDSSTNTYTARVPAGLTDKVVMFGGPPKDFTFYASGDNPFVIVSAVRLLPTASVLGVKDFGSFMPIPLTSKNCSEYSVNDYHLADLSSANYFTMTSPSRDCGRFQVLALGTTSNYSEALFLTSGTVHHPIIFSSKRYGQLLVFRSQNARVEMVRYGGYGMSAGPGKGQGAFLDNLPSRDQFVTGITPYTTYKGNDQVTVFGDANTRNSATNDGVQVPTNSWQEVLYYGNVMYFTVANIENGTHFFSASGRYIIHVSGSTDNHAQGYTPRFIWRNTPEPPLTTTLQPPSSTSTSTTPPPPTTTTVQPPATTTTLPTKGVSIMKLSTALLLMALSSLILVS